MYWIPPFKLIWSNGFLMILPMLVIRFLLPKGKTLGAMAKLQYFPETFGIERFALRIYFITNSLLVFSPLFFPLAPPPLLLAGILIELLGLVIFTLSIMTFSSTAGFVESGIYRHTRNPMYIGYLLVFLATGVAMANLFYLILTILYQIAVHFLILSEERWCKATYGQPYKDYLDRVTG